MIDNLFPLALMVFLALSLIAAWVAALRPPRSTANITLAQASDFMLGKLVQVGTGPSRRIGRVTGVSDTALTVREASDFERLAYRVRSMWYGFWQGIWR